MVKMILLVLSAASAMPFVASGAGSGCFVGEAPAAFSGARAESVATTVFLGRSCGRPETDFELRSLTAMESDATGIDMTLVPGFLLFLK